MAKSACTKRTFLNGFCPDLEFFVGFITFLALIHFCAQMFIRLGYLYGIKHYTLLYEHLVLSTKIFLTVLVRKRVHVFGTYFMNKIGYSNNYICCKL